MILYSHMEGYVKIALLTYIHYINGLNLKRKDVIPGLMAASMNTEFADYENTQRKSKDKRLHKQELSDDAELHLFSRRVEFLENIEGFREEILNIKDSAVNTESNLRYTVLMKNLHQLGLPLNLFQECEGVINELVNRRNPIAHGEFLAGVSQKDFSNWESKVNRVMTDITRLLYDYAKHQRYLRNPPE